MYALGTQAPSIFRSKQSLQCAIFYLRSDVVITADHEWLAAIQVGASNELPESEELDALYDRFLIRRRVGQVSLAGLPGLLSGNRQQLHSTSAQSNGAGMVNRHEAGLALSETEMEDIRYTEHFL